jgi:hypothetical protein
MIGLLVALLIPAAFVFIAGIRGMHPALGWVISWLILPILSFFEVFVLPYSGGGAAFWPIVFILGGFIGVIGGGIGAILVTIYLKMSTKQNEAP